MLTSTAAVVEITKDQKDQKRQNLEVYVCSVLKTWPDLVAEAPEDGEAKDGAGAVSDVDVT